MATERKKAASAKNEGAHRPTKIAERSARAATAMEITASGVAS